jgi:hypothetical protein
MKSTRKSQKTMKSLKHLKESQKLRRLVVVEAIKQAHGLGSISAKFVESLTLSRLICGSICASIKESNLLHAPSKDVTASSRFVLI